MARVFVEEAIRKSGNSPYELIKMAAKRGREISQGSQPVSPKRHKDEKARLQCSFRRFFRSEARKKVSKL